MRFLMIGLWIFVFSGTYQSLFAQARRIEDLYQDYSRYREKSLVHRRFGVKAIEPLILRMKKEKDVQVRLAGHSVENRPIYLVKIGHGKMPVLLWSQMHGDESTATMALMDLFNFFRADDDFNPLREKLKEELTLYFIPMLNPDGAERFVRRNALGIDLNRDARRLASPESKLLKEIRDRIEPQFGFNLHDQEKYYSAGYRPVPATITFLAPAFNEAEDMNEVRGNAARLIVLLNRLLQRYIPNGVGKWNDSFEPRAFGEMMTYWGTSTVLIESGGYPNDPERQVPRKLNFVCLIAAFDAIASRTYHKENLNEYFNIPKNQKKFHDLILRNLKIQQKGFPYVADVAFKRKEVSYDNAKRYFVRAGISDIGDLSPFYGYEEVDATKMEYIPGRIYPKQFRNLKQLFQKVKNPVSLLKKGYTAVRVKRFKRSEIPAGFPLKVIGRKERWDGKIGLGKNPCFLLRKPSGRRLAVSNGRLIKLD